MKKEQPSEEIQRLLKQVLDHFDKEDTAVRERQIRTWRRLKLFWENFQRAWYSEVAHDWRIWDQATDSDTQQDAYDKPINVFRAYLESIIAALSVVVPPIKCFPDDADDTLDLTTAKAGDKIAELIFRHNDVTLLWLHALFIYCTEGMIACHTYPKSDEKYGTYEEKKYEDVEESVEKVTCPMCGETIDEREVNPEEMMAQPSIPDEGGLMPGMPMPGGQLGMPEPQMNPENPEDEFRPDMQDYGSELCPHCSQIMVPQISRESFTVTRLVGTTTLPKTRVCLEAYGGLYVKVPNYARKQEDCPYLIFSYETHYANAIERFEHLHGKNSLKAQKISTSVGPQDPYEQWGRLSPQYQGEYPQNTVTIRNCWFRPAAFNVLNKEEALILKKEYPKGVMGVWVNDEFGEAEPRVLDDEWTLTYNPLSDYIHNDPLGLLLVSIQEITNDLIALTLQTIEHGIGQTFADPGVLDFEAYRDSETIPGGIYEATPKSGKTIRDSFHEIKTATLSPEVMPFANNIQSLAQLVSGALPSLFGGQLEGSETASQYSMSRAQALQRLQNVWKMLQIWWKNIFGKAIPTYIKEMKVDERDVRRNDDGSFINVFIRKAELEGKIGRVELEANENLPLTWSQQKDIVMQLLNAANPEILQILGAPENLPVIRKAIGLNDFYVPGEDDREKQYDEIKQLLNSEPIETGDPMMPEMASVDVDPVYDNHSLEFEIVRKWVISEAGRQAKIDNPAGYKNVLLHGKMHMMVMQQMQPSAPPEEKGAPPGEQPNELNSQPGAPITGEENVATVQ